MESRAFTDPIAERSVSVRSAISNGTRLHRRGRGTDGRTRDAKRFRDLFDAFANSLGGLAGLSEADRSLARMAATLQLRAEAMQADAAKGLDIDAEQLVRVSNSLARVLGKLGKRTAAAAPTTLDNLARLYPAARR
jgi:hypothetical protein